MKKQRRKKDKAPARDLFAPELRRSKRITANTIMMYEISDYLNEGDRNLKSLETPINVDISTGGLQMISTQKIASGKHIKIILSLPPTPVAIEIIGKVVWTKEMGENKQFQTGVEFVEFLNNHQDLIKNYIYKQG
ncbi:MAG: PilZ domain-containing protein [bacterium]|nr:PilZ domain-containing protein [bacterium]